jgi:DNA-binding IclR family transcriptional regulator
VLTGTPALAEYGTILNLPARAPRVLEALRQIGPTRLEELAGRTDLPGEEVRSELELLGQQRLVLVLQRDNHEQYKATL